MNICAPTNLDPYDSYGHVALELARHLTRMGVYTNLFAMGKREMATQDEELGAIVQQPIRPALGSIMLGYPIGYHLHSNPLVHIGPRVALTMFESSKLPAAWIAPLNDMDAVIVPSTFCETVFRDSGVTVPVHVVPLGVGDAYQYVDRTHSEQFRTVPNTFRTLANTSEHFQGRPLTFLAFFDRGERKGGMVAQQAFTYAFGDDMRYRLILKARTAKPGRELVLTNRNIEVIHQDMSEQELYELYCRCDVLINPHKGEGFGLLPREFAATGGFALTTGWSGTADAISEWGYALPYKLEPAKWQGNKVFEGQDLGMWAKLDPVAVAAELETVAATWQWTKQLLPAKAQAARELYSWRSFSERVLNVWREAAHGNRDRTPAIAA